jgi:hypothetical protein
MRHNDWRSQALPCQLVHLHPPSIAWLSTLFVFVMKKFLKIISSKKRRQHLPDTGVESTESQSTSNLIPDASALDPCPVGCEILFEGTTPILAE